MTDHTSALDAAREARDKAESKMLEATANGHALLTISRAHWNLHEANEAIIEAQQARICELEAANAATASLTFTVERTRDYQQTARKYPYSANELAGANYVVTISNGDSHLLNTVEQVKALISDELFLRGYYDSTLAGAGENE